MQADNKIGCRASAAFGRGIRTICQRRSLRRGIHAALWLGALVAGVSTASRAEINVEGTATAMRVTTSQDRMSDMLSALGAAFNVRYRTAVGLDDVVSGTYSGSLRQVLSRLLDDYNYVIRTDQDTIDVVVVGRHGERPVAVQPSPASPAKNIASQWR
jgi:hypothetical protein